MPRPSLAEAVLELCLKATQRGSDLLSDDYERRAPAVAQLFQDLGALEQVAARRVDLNTYENHRRALEACHVSIKVPGPRDGQ